MVANFGTSDVEAKFPAAGGVEELTFTLFTLHCYRVRVALGIP